jgi:hypothetical protein
VPLRLLYLIFWHVLGLVLLIGRTSAAKDVDDPGSVRLRPLAGSRCRDRTDLLCAAPTVDDLCDRLAVPVPVIGGSFRTPAALGDWRDLRKRFGRLARCVARRDSDGFYGCLGRAGMRRDIAQRTRLESSVVV